MMTIRHVGDELLVVAGIEDKRSRACPTCGATLEDRDELVVDLDGNIAIADGRAIRLTAGQAELLYALARIAPRSCSFDTLAVALWGAAEWPEDWRMVIRVQVAMLRRALAPTRYGIVNQYGHGYSLVRAAAAAEGR